jgi:hypothetical protein
MFTNWSLAKGDKEHFTNLVNTSSSRQVTKDFVSSHNINFKDKKMNFKSFFCKSRGAKSEIKDDSIKKVFKFGLQIHYCFHFNENL